MLEVIEVIKVALDRVVPLTEARSRLSEIVDNTVGDHIWVISKGGKPKVAIVDVQYLDNLLRRAWFDALSAKTQGAFRAFLVEKGLDPDRLSEEEIERILAS